MRKIDKSILEALSKPETGRIIPTGGNTQVKITSNGWEISLHGHTIATKSGSRIMLAHCGWVTATTAARLNALTTSLRLGCVGRKLGAMHFEPWINGNPETRAPKRTITADGVIL